MSDYTAKYKKNRAILLAGSPDCALCGGPGADTADHIIPKMHGGGDELDNLQPAHGSCNYRRGQRDQAAAAARRRASRPEGFFQAITDTPSAIFSDFPENQPELARTGGNRSGSVPTGRELPRLETAGLGSDEFGHRVASWAQRVMGVELMPWQVRALAGQLSTGADGRLMFRESLVSTARQNGKSIALQALVGWWLTEMPVITGRPQNVLSIANRLDRAEAIHTQLAPHLENWFDGKARYANGQKAVLMADGSVWEVRAASRHLHGGSYDLVVVDEAFDIAPEVLDEALRPAQIARPMPLLSVWSTAGDEGSKFLMGMREGCLADIDAGVTGLTYMAEWSLPPGSDVRDEQLWGFANPSLGTTITIDALRAASKKDSFLRAHLNLWVTARGAWLPADAWAHLADPTPLPAGGFLAVETSLDDSRYFGVRAVADAGVVRVEVAFTASTEEECFDRIAELMADGRMTLVVPPNLEIHVPVPLRHRTQIAGYKEILKYTTTIRAMILERKIRHRDQHVLNEHVNRAVLSKTGEGVVVSTQKSPGPIEACRAMIWATALASRPVNRAKPLIAVSG